jgi:hemin uptake protein HemP
MNSPPDRAPPHDALSHISHQTTPAAAAAPETTHRIQSHEVMQGRNAIAIEHNGSVYRLQTTRQGKLILTK